MNGVLHTYSDYVCFYYVSIFVLFVICLVFKLTKDSIPTRIFVCLAIVYMSYIIGGRPLDIGTDTQSYSIQFNQATNLSFGKVMQYFVLGGDPLFKLLLLICSSLTDYNGCLFVIAGIMNLAYYNSCRLLYRENKQFSPLLALLFILASFTCCNQQFNVIRSGVAIAFFLNFLYWLLKGNVVKSIIYGSLAIGFHFSTIIFIVIAVVSKLLQRFGLKYYYIVFWLCLVLAFLGKSVLDLGTLQDMDFNKVQHYAGGTGNSDYQVGFRWTFALFNVFFFLILRILYLNSKVEEFYIKQYLAYSGLFFLWFTIPYSDRIGAFSWIIIPVALYYCMSVRFGSGLKWLPYCAFLGYAILNIII